MEQPTILLIHPLGYKFENAKTDISRKANIMPPLGLASIVAYLEQFKIQSHIVDCYAHPESDEVIKDYLRRERPAFIGFSCTTATFLDGVRIAEYAIKIIPGTKIIFGGVHVSALKEKILQLYKVINYVVVGEGEHTLYQLISSKTTDVENIKNIVFRANNGEILFTGYRKKLIDLDTLPFPAFEKLTGYPECYKLTIFNYPRVPNASCISSRGCPYSCSYCDRSVFKRSFRYNSAQYLYNHLKYLNKKFKIKHVNFYDDQFTFNRARVESFTQLMIKEPLNITFNCAARAEHLDFELLKLMKKAGCWMISIGIETGDESLLAQHRQNPDLTMMSNKIRLIKKAGIRVKGLLMMGLPGESEESIKKSKAYVFSLPIDDFNLAKFTPFPGSPIYKQIKEQGSDLGPFEENWEKMDCMQFLFIPKNLTKDRMETLFIDFYKSYFRKTKVLLGYVSMLWKSPDSWLRFLNDIVGFLKFAFTNKPM